MYLLYTKDTLKSSAIVYNEYKMTNQKKTVPYTVRVESEIAEVVQKLADDDERTISFVLRKLLLEALQSRKLLKKKK